MGGMGVRVRSGHYSRKRVQQLGGSEVRRSMVVYRTKKTASAKKVREEVAPMRLESQVGVLWRLCRPC